jgi:hypothetical protein
MKIIGADFEVRDIPLDELIDPHDLYSFTFEGYRDTVNTIPRGNSRPLKTIKTTDLRALQYSIRKYGLLNPPVVVELTGEMLEEYQKRIKFGAKWMDKETAGYEWMIEKLKRKYAIVDGQRRYFALMKLIHNTDEVAIRCLVYPYTTFTQMKRHSVEDNKFSVRPETVYLDVADREI